MTKKQIIVFLLGWIFTIAVFGLGFNWFMKFNMCNQDYSEISSLVDKQDQWIYSYFVFSELNNIFFFFFFF